MSLLSVGIGRAVASIMGDAKPVIDHYFPSVAERANAQAVLEKLAMVPDSEQVKIDIAEAKTGNLFIAGWRPAVGWMCALGVAWVWAVAPLLSACGVAVPMDHAGGLADILYAMLGIEGGTQVSHHWATRGQIARDMPKLGPPNA